MMVAICFPFLKRMGYGMTWKQAVVLTWAGLRGAVGLSLALFVQLDTKIENAQYRFLTFFMMGEAPGPFNRLKEASEMLV